MRVALAWLVTGAMPWFSAFTLAAEGDYLRDIKPVLQARCYSCHGALKQKAGLRLDTAERIRAGGDGGAILTPGKPNEGALLSRLTTDDVHERMPLEAAPLKPEQIEAIRRWIAEGAPIPPGEKGEEDPRDHWSFRRIEKPAVPTIAGAAHPIDAFLSANQAAHSLKSQPEAERSILLRRLYLDLVGLPPTLDQLRDSRPYEVIVDELLQSPQHGERWTRHWMDVWRYSDWYGLGVQLRNSQKHLWHWRDWIVESLNADKGYDRMILEMLAGDELAPNDPEVVRATGFLARNYYLFNRTTWLDDTIEHTGKAFLGLTLNCAKCHDHKYDPIDQVDYYRFRALFEPHQVRLDPVPGVTDFEMDGLPRVFDDHLDEPTYLHVRGDPATPDKELKITPGVPTVLASFAPPIEPVKLPVEAWAPITRDHVKADRLVQARAKVEAARRDLEKAHWEWVEAKPAESAKPAKQSEGGGGGEIWLRDDFDRADPGRWEIIGEGWQYEGGRLIQSQSTREVAMARTREVHPEDFELTCRFTTTGGETYQSVTFRFDLSDDGKEANFVYTSAHAAGPKVQVAHTAGGQTTYPPEGRAGKAIEVGKLQELRFAVRDQLVNVWLDGEFCLAYRLPRRHPGGKLALSGFDATVAFDSIEIRALPDGLTLTDARSGAKATGDAPRDPALAVQIAEAKLAVAEADLAFLQSVIAAEEGKIASKEETLAKVASQREGEAMKAKAALDLVLLEGSDDGKKLKEANDALAKAEKKIAAKDAIYTPLWVAKKALETPAHKEADYPTTYPEASSGRRLMLARWMTSRENPLTARVAVNQVWMRHFGDPLVETPSDFGRQAKRPIQRELLDFLAAEFMESGWSFRHLHRLIVTSEAYRRTSSNAGADPATLGFDPANRYYWRANPRRMESQVVRDSLLSLADSLDPAVGGPSIDPRAPNQRRGLYLKTSRDDQDKFLSMFDDADILQCYRRSESIVPQQALALSNSGLSLSMSEKIAARLFAAHPSEDRSAFIGAAFEQILGRRPDAAERGECDLFWKEMTEVEAVRQAADPESAIRSRLVHALLNHNDFVTIR